MTEQLSNRQLAERLYRNPGGGQLVVFHFAPIDVNVIPDDALVVAMKIVPLDWRHIIDCQVVIAHDGKNLGKAIRAGEYCLRYCPRELLTWRVTDNDWVLVADRTGKAIKRCPGIW